MEILARHLIRLDIHQRHQVIHRLHHHIHPLHHHTHQRVRHIRQLVHHIHRLRQITHQQHHLTSVRVAQNTSVHRHILPRHRATHHRHRNILQQVHHIHQPVRRRLPAHHTIQLHPIILLRALTIRFLRRPILQVLRMQAATYTVHQLFLKFHQATRRKVQRHTVQKEVHILQEHHRHIHLLSRAYRRKIRHTHQQVLLTVQVVHRIAVHHIVNKISKKFFFMNIPFNIFFWFY